MGLWKKSRGNPLEYKAPCNSKEVKMDVFTIASRLYLFGSLFEQIHGECLVLLNFNALKRKCKTNAELATKQIGAPKIG